MSDPKIKYDIEAAVKGDADAEKLAATLRGLSATLEGDLKESALNAAKSLEALGAQQGALESFAGLKRETADLGAELTEAAAKVDSLGAELPAAAARTQELADAQGAAAARLQDAQANLQGMKDQLKSLQGETAGAARRTSEYREAVAGLNTGIKAATQEVSKQQASLKDAKQASAQAQQAEEKLRKEYDLAVGSTAKLSGEYRAKTTALNSSRAAMQAAGVSTENLSGQQQQLKAAVEQVKQKVAGMAPAYQQAATASTQSTQVQVSNHRKLRDGMESISTTLGRIQKIATAAMGAGMFGGVIKSVAATADEFKNLESRIKRATGEGADFHKAFSEVQRIALETNSALDETGNLFARLAETAKAGGASAQEATRLALGLTKTINQAVQLGGSSIEESRSSIDTFIRSLQLGEVSGRDFNGMLKDTPRLAQAMADGLGVSAARLKQMAAQGQLTSETVINALEGQAGAIDAEFSKLPITVGRALENLRTHWTQYVGESNNGIISTNTAAKAIDLLARNLDTLVEALTVAGRVYAAMKISQLVEWFGSWATRTLAATKAIYDNSAATTANTAAHVANAAAVTASAAAQTGSAAATAASTAAQALNAKSWTSMGEALKGAAAGQGAFQAAAARATASVAAQSSATAGMAGSAAAAAGRVGILGTAVRGLTGLIGGPVGLIATVVMLGPEIKRLGEWLGESAAKMMGYRDRSNELSEQWKITAKVAEEFAKTNRENARRLQETRDASFDLTTQSRDLIAEFDKATKSGKKAGDAIAEIGKKFDPSTVDGIRAMSSTLQKLAADGKLTADQVHQAWAQALNGQDLLKFQTLAQVAFAKAGEEADKLQAKLDAARAAGAAKEVVDELQRQVDMAVSAATTASERMAEVMDNSVREAVKRSGLSFDDLQGKIGAASRSALNDLEILEGGLDNLKAQGVDTARALEASIGKAIDTADSQQAIDAVRSRIEALRDELGAPATEGLLERAEERALALSDALDAARPGINSVREAMKQLGVTTDAELQKAADKAGKAYDAIVSSGKASERELSDAFKRAAEAAIKASDGVAPEWVKLEAAARGYRLEVDAAGDAQLKLGDKMLAGADKVQAAFKLMGVQTQQELAQTATQYKDAYDTMLLSGQATGEGLEKAFKRYAEAAIAANDGVASGMLQDEAALRGLTIEYDKHGKAVVKSADEMGDAMQRAMRKGTEAIQEQMTWLERMEQRNKQVSQNSILNERDKNGFSTDKDGKTIGATQQTWLSIYNMVKQMGLDEEQARGIANKAFPNGKYSAQLQKEQMHGKLDSIDVSAAARRAAEEIIRNNAGGQVAVKRKADGGADKAGGAPSRQDAGGAAPASPGGQRGGGATYVTNITYKGETSTYRTDDKASNDSLKELMDRLMADKRRAA